MDSIRSFRAMWRLAGQAGDVLLGISTSGNSEDVIRAAEVARKQGLKVVVLTGKPNGRLTGFCDVEISAPPTRFSDRAQEIHIKVIHTLVQLIEVGMGLADEDDADAAVEVDAKASAGTEVPERLPGGEPGLHVLRNQKADFGFYFLQEKL